MWQKGDNHFINLLNKVRVGNADRENERTLKPRIICSRNFHYVNYGLHVFAEIVSVFIQNKVMLNQINSLPITIDIIDSIFIGCRFSESQIVAARNQSVYQTGGLSKTLTQKMESKIIFTTNIDITDCLVNEVIGVIKYFKFFRENGDIIYIIFDDVNAGKKSIQTDNVSRCNIWISIKIIETYTNVGNSYISISIQWTQIPLKVPLTYH